MGAVHVKGFGPACSLIGVLWETPRSVTTTWAFPVGSELDLPPPQAWWPWASWKGYKPGSWQGSGTALRNGMGTVLWGESYVGKSSHLSPGRGWVGMVEG